MIPNQIVAPFIGEDTRKPGYFWCCWCVMNPGESLFTSHCPSFLPTPLFRHILRFKLPAYVTKVQITLCSGLQRNEGRLFSECAISHATCCKGKVFQNLLRNPVILFSDDKTSLSSEEPS